MTGTNRHLVTQETHEHYTVEVHRIETAGGPWYSAEVYYEGGEYWISPNLYGTEWKALQVGRERPIEYTYRNSTLWPGDE